MLSGFDEALNRRVAVKLLHRRDILPTAAARLELVEGVRSAACIKHGNLITVYAVETVNDLPVIVASRSATWRAVAGRWTSRWHCT